jgi:hypothetical protein
MRSFPQANIRGRRSLIIKPPTESLPEVTAF